MCGDVLFASLSLSLSLSLFFFSQRLKVFLDGKGAQQVAFHNFKGGFPSVPSLVFMTLSQGPREAGKVLVVVADQPKV